jgi:hypothetical protein
MTERVPAKPIDEYVVELAAKALSDEQLNRAEINYLYDLEPESPDAFYLRWAARQKAKAASSNHGLIYAQLGIGAQP